MNHQVEKLEIPDAEVTLYRGFFGELESDRFFQSLLNTVNWRQDTATLFGKKMDLPRKIAWYGDRHQSYAFSGIHLHPQAWTPELLQIKTRIETVAPVQFNSVLLNLYRNGQDSISWHSDAEPSLGKNPVIGSISFGATRRFMLRHRQQKAWKTAVELTHGSFLLMAGKTQHCWQHQIPKTPRVIEPRINLTFRVILA